MNLVLRHDPNLDLVDLFWSHVIKSDEEDGCWNWTKGASAYGLFAGMGAHSFIWKCVLGRDVPEGKLLHHRCLNKRCVNPAHLECLTSKEHRSRHPILRRRRVAVPFVPTDHLDGINESSYTVKELATLEGKSVEFIKRQIDDGLLAASRFSPGVVRIHPDQIRAWRQRAAAVVEIAK